MKVIIESIGETQSFGTGDFKKREWVGVDNSNPTYPTPIKFECIKDKCSLLDAFAVGEEVEVEYNITGNRWTNPKGVEVIFNGFQAWKIESVSGSTNQTPSNVASNDPSLDLPF